MIASSVYWIFTKLDHMILLWKGKNPIYFGVIIGQGHCYYKYNFWQQGRFRTITLVLYIGSLPNLATWLPCGRGRTLFILGSLPLYRLIIYIRRAYFVMHTFLVTLCRMITWVVFLRMFWNFISSLVVKRGGSLSFLVGTISNVLVMEIGWTDVGSGGYILVNCAHSNTSFF
jgi:hypothetical protein